VPPQKKPQINREDETLFASTATTACSCNFDGASVIRPAVEEILAWPSLIFTSFFHNQFSKGFSKVVLQRMSFAFKSNTKKICRQRRKSMQYWTEGVCNDSIVIGSSKM